MPSYYDLLGVTAEADFEQIRRAYHRRAQLLHPDRHPDASEAERREAEAAMKALNEAWYTLRNPDARRRYDTELGLRPPRSLGDEAVEHRPPAWPEAPAWDDAEPERPRRSRAVRLVVVVVIVVGMLSSAVAWFAEPDNAGAARWSAGAIADLRFRALNAGMTAPQANCFVEALTSRFGPSDPVPEEAVRYLADACR